MRLQQLRYLRAIVKSGLSVTAAAERLYTSQPGMSKQLRLLEEELGVPIFERSGRQFTGITPAGKTILEQVECVLNGVEAIRQIAREFSDPQRGGLSIATTHTQARYVLPPAIRDFARTYPQIELHLHQGNPMQIAELAESGAVDFAIATEAMEYFENLIMMPCYRWNRAVVVPCDHPLRDEAPLTLEAVAKHPILTYVFGFTGRSQLDAAFKSRGLTPKVVFTATDADVIKTYIRLGLGAGIVAKMAYDPRLDTGLCALDAGHLFEPSTCWIGFRHGLFLRAYHYDFLRYFAPYLTPEVVDAAVRVESKEERERLFGDLPMPQR